MPKQLQSGRVTQILQRAFGFKGRYVPMLDEVIVPVYVIADPSPAETTRLCAGDHSAFASPIGDEFPAVQLFNPVGSGIVVNVTKGVVTSETKELFNVSFYDTPLPAGTQVSFRDRRNTLTLDKAQRRPSCQLLRDNTSTVQLGEQIATLETDGTLSQTAAWEATAGDIRQPMAILGPGQGVIIQRRTALSAFDQFRVAFQWLEIPITQTNPDGGLS